MDQSNDSTKEGKWKQISEATIWLSRLSVSGDIWWAIKFAIINGKLQNEMPLFSTPLTLSLNDDRQKISS
ncbi:MAG: hypothetical protein LBH17_08295 [Oscillospiraceae bacterium]|jgi:hypothetical protein|nr:hypothetical protein [Oscillospiraceae bacterium]